MGWYTMLAHVLFTTVYGLSVCLFDGVFRRAHMLNMEDSKMVAMEKLRCLSNRFRTYWTPVHAHIGRASECAWDLGVVLFSRPNCSRTRNAHRLQPWFTALMLTIVCDMHTSDHGVAGVGKGGWALDLLEEAWEGVERHKHLEQATRSSAVPLLR